MDEQKKQKVLIGVLAVVALGAGGYWFAARDSGGDSGGAITLGGGERKERTKTVATERKADRKERTERKSAPREVKRKERETVDRSTVSRKKRSRTDRKKVKKESMVPAA